MTVSRIPASADPEPATRGPDRATVRHLYLLVRGAFTDQATTIWVDRDLAPVSGLPGRSA